MLLTIFCSNEYLDWLDRKKFESRKNQEKTLKQKQQKRNGLHLYDPSNILIEISFKAQTLKHFFGKLNDSLSFSLNCVI